LLTTEHWPAQLLFQRSILTGFPLAFCPLLGASCVETVAIGSQKSLTLRQPLYAGECAAHNWRHLSLRSPMQRRQFAELRRHRRSTTSASSAVVPTKLHTLSSSSLSRARAGSSVSWTLARCAVFFLPGRVAFAGDPKDPLNPRMLAAHSTPPESGFLSLGNGTLGLQYPAPPQALPRYCCLPLDYARFSQSPDSTSGDSMSDTS